MDNQYYKNLIEAMESLRPKEEIVEYQFRNNQIT